MDDLVKVRVRSGTHHADDKTHQVGDELTVPTAVYEAFADKFDLIGTAVSGEEGYEGISGEEGYEGMEDDGVEVPPIPDLSHYESLNALLVAVDSGEVTAADALAWEQSRPIPRKTAVKMLEARL